MNVEIGTETPIFFFWEYLFRIFGVLSLQCILTGSSKGITWSRLILLYQKSQVFNHCYGRQTSSQIIVIILVYYCMLFRFFYCVNIWLLLYLFTRLRKSSWSAGPHMNSTGWPRADACSMRLQGPPTIPWQDNWGYKGPTATILQGSICTLYAPSWGYIGLKLSSDTTRITLLRRLKSRTAHKVDTKVPREDLTVETTYSVLNRLNYCRLYPALVNINYKLHDITGASSYRVTGIKTQYTF